MARPNWAAFTACAKCCWRQGSLCSWWSRTSARYRGGASRVQCLLEGIMTLEGSPQGLTAERIEGSRRELSL